MLRDSWKWVSSHLSIRSSSFVNNRNVFVRTCSRKWWTLHGAVLHEWNRRLLKTSKQHTNKYLEKNASCGRYVCFDFDHWHKDYWISFPEETKQSCWYRIPNILRWRAESIKYGRQNICTHPMILFSFIEFISPYYNLEKPNKNNLTGAVP